MILHKAGGNLFVAALQLSNTSKRIIMDINELSNKIIGAAIEVHKVLGPGLLESAYEECLSYELHLRGYSFEIQKPLPVIYKEKILDCGYRLDMVVENAIILELKSCEKIISLRPLRLCGE